MKTSTGFSLVEMAMVLLIVSLLIGGLLTPLSGQMTQQQIKQTNTTLREIKEALVGFAITQRRLPCPDYPPPASAPLTDVIDGVEDINSIYDVEERCKDGYEGFLPWATLGVEREDAWGNPFRYRVISGYAYVAPSEPPPLPLDEFIKSDGELKDELKSNLKIQDFDGNYLSVQSGDTRIVAIIFSYGKDGQPYSENDGTNLTYVEDSYVENRFDDILVRISSNTLFNRLVASGRYW